MSGPYELFEQKKREVKKVEIKKKKKKTQQLVGQYQNAQNTFNWNLRRKRLNLRKEWAKDVSNLMSNINPHTQEAQRSCRKVNKPKRTLKFIIRKLLKTDNQKNAKQL